MNQVTIEDGKVIEHKPDVQNNPAFAPSTTTTQAHLSGNNAMVEPLFWMRTVPVMLSELYLRGTDTLICASTEPVPNWFRRQFAKLAGFEWRSC